MKIRRRRFNAPVNLYSARISAVLDYGANTSAIMVEYWLESFKAALTALPVRRCGVSLQ